jgi:dolichyl-phosphate-mannose-protein mannosyltransferase
MFSKIKTDLKENLVLYYLLLSGFLIRLIFANFPGFHVDTDTFFAWSVRAAEVGLANFYSKDIWTNYTPGMIYLFYFLGVIKNIFPMSSDTFYYLLKIPSSLADLGLAYLVYKQLLKTNSRKIAFYGLAFCLFNPVLIFNAGVWGAFDGLMTLFLFLAVFYLDRKKLITSSVYFGISLLLKPQAIAIAPVYGLYLLKNFSIKNILKLSLPALLSVVILSVPFFPSDPLFGFFKLFIQMTQDYKGNSLFAYNTWGIFGFWIDDSTTITGIPYRIWGILLLSIFWIYFYILFFKRKFDTFTLSTLAFLAFFFLPTRVHERYLFSAIPFLILTALQFKSKILLASTAFLSLIHVLNLYYVYVYYNEFHLQLPKVLYLEGFYEFLESQAKLLSAISTLLFLIITITISRIILKHKHGH